MYKPCKKPFLLTIFGASGDLAKLKLFPAIYALAERKLLPEDFFIVGYSRTKKRRDEFQKEFLFSVVESVGKNENFSTKILDSLVSHVHYFSGEYQDKADFEKYRTFIKNLVGSSANIPHLAYFSVPPSVFEPIIRNLAETRVNKNEDLRIILEKPFGEDEESAKRLFNLISQFYREEQVYLLDHYLGKRSVQSILSLRHSNSILNMLLKGREISTIQITAVEDIGIRDRVGYFDTVGIIKDMFQSHLTQILAMITMSIPISEDAESFQREKYAILSALKFAPDPDNIFLGQYKSYKKLDGVKKDSKTETFMSAKIKIDRESWYGVPIFIRTGKQLQRKATYIVVEFKKMRFQKDMEPNRLILELQPNEKIHFQLSHAFGGEKTAQVIAPFASIGCPPEGCVPEHSTLLLDVLHEEKLHFLSFAEIIAAWRITDSILQYIAGKNIPVEEYEDGILCPEGSYRNFQKEGETWFEI